MKSNLFLGVMLLIACSAFLTNCKDEEVLPPVSISSISPEEGYVGDAVIISGEHFNVGNGMAEVFFNGTPANVLSADATAVQVLVPEGATTGKITVVVSGKEALSTNDFTVMLPPAITNFAPNAGGVGSSVIINGSNFSTIASQNVVSINGVTAPVTAASSGQLTITIPQGATSGKFTVSLKGKAVTSTDDFTIVPTNEWKAVADFAGPGRYYSVGFAIGNKGYVGTGRRPGGVKAKDLWEYNTETNVWTQKADLPAVGREGAVAFAIGDKGYIGTGTTGIKQSDMWEYDPQLNNWVRKDDFGGGDRANAFVFVSGTKAYVGSGVHGELHERMRDLWEFDPARTTGQQWIQKASIKDELYTGDISGLPGAAFSLSGKGYVAIPLSNGTMPDFWEFNPAANSWTPKGKTPVDILSSSESVSFSLNQKGYILFGALLWRYDATTNTWLQKANFPLANIRYATGFTNGTHGFAGLGYTSAESLKFYKYYPD